MMNYYTRQTGFYGRTSPDELIRQFGSPLYVYNEALLRQHCREMADLIKYLKFKAMYSTKANSNTELLKIIREEGLHADAMSPGELYLLKEVGYTSDEIFYVCNNVSADEMRYVIDSKVTISVDSISQLRTLGKINPGGSASVRFNPGIGAGHHEKVVTAGKHTKFGIDTDQIDEVKSILKEYGIKLVGINQHIGSLFMDGKQYMEGAKTLLAIAEQFEGLEFIDLGGGFGIPYHKQDGEPPLDFSIFHGQLSRLLTDWAAENNPGITFKSEPGRYVVAECGVLLGTVNALKQNHSTIYAGTDLGFNVLIRPTLYDSYHDIEVYGKSAGLNRTKFKTYTVVGNICESGDIIAKDRMLPELSENDIIGVMDAGAYGYSMSSNYNNRLRPAEVLIRTDGTPELIRRRETLEDLVRCFGNSVLSK